MSKKMPVLELIDIQHSFGEGTSELHILKGANLTVSPGEIVALIGPSGAGKSTLLHIAGLLETPAGGDVILNGYDCLDLEDRDRTALRRSELGFVYQAHNLLPEFDALENVALPLEFAGKAQAFDLARDQLAANLTPEQMAEAKKRARDWEPMGKTKSAHLSSK